MIPRADPPLDAGCPIGKTGWRLVIELFYNPDQAMRFGLLTFGAESFGQYTGAPPTTERWVDHTSIIYGGFISRGNLRPNIDEPVDEFTFDMLDPAGDWVDWRPPESLSSPNLNTPVRVGLINTNVEPGTYYTMYQGRVERLLDTHDDPVRNITFESYGTKSDLVTSLLQPKRPRETALARINAILSQIGWENGYDDSWPPPNFTTTMLEADGEIRYDEEATAYSIIQEAAVSCGYHVGITRLGEFRVHPIIDPQEPPTIVFADCYQEGVTDIDAIATSIEFVSDSSEVLNVVQLINKRFPQQSAQAIDAQSIARWGRRADGYGFPAYIANDSSGQTQTLANQIVAASANIVNRVERVTFNTLTDPNWWTAFLKMEIGETVTVRRYKPRLIEFRCTIIGIDWVLSEAGYIEGNINLSTLEETLKGAV